MEIVVIADDLTGANDTGVQFARKGLPAFTVLNPEEWSPGEAGPGAIVVDTDTRFAPAGEAYGKVQSVCRKVREAGGASLLYKKIDSTLRGNIGTELDAVADAWQPDLVCIAPAYPRNGRQVVGGRLLVHGVPVHETEAGRDPKTPVTVSAVAARIAEQSNRACGHVPLQTIRAGREALLAELALRRSQGVPYLLFDGETEDDLRLTAEALAASPCAIVWCGSAGLADWLPVGASGSEGASTAETPAERTLTAVGSVSGRSRSQLAVLLEQPFACGIRLRPDCVFDPVSAGREQERVAGLAEDGYRQGKQVVLYTDASPDALERVGEGERSAGLPNGEGSRLIAELIGRIAAELTRRYGVEGLVLTGGDTARQTLLQLGADRVRLLDELESGVPIGLLAGGPSGGSGMRIITKAGSFGGENVLRKAVNRLLGRNEG